MKIKNKEPIVKCGLSCLTQWLAACEGFLITSVGMATLGWTSPFLGHLSRPNPPFQVTAEQISWIASLVSIHRPVGSILVSVAISRVGSKAATWLSGICFMLAWTLMIYATSIEYIFVSLIFTGIGMGAISTSFNVYLSEIANPEIRGALVCLVIHGAMVGVLFGNIMGALFPVWSYATFNMALTTLFLVSFYFFPNSPYYLISQNKMVEAYSALRWYSRDKDTVAELHNLKEFLETSPRLSFFNSLKQLNTPQNRRTLIVLNITYSLIQFSGIYTILEYSEIIFMKANVTIIKPSTLVTIMTALGIPACWLAMWTTDRFGRTTMLSTSCFLFGVALTGWAVNFQLLDLGYHDPKLQWIVIIFTVLYRISLNIGLSPIVPLLITELFPPNVKSAGSCICDIFMSICMFISNKNFQSMISYFGYKYVFCLFATLISFVGFFSKCFIPETKGKSLADIQTVLNNNTKTTQLVQMRIKKIFLGVKIV